MFAEQKQKVHMYINMHSITVNKRHMVYETEISAIYRIVRENLFFYGVSIAQMDKKS